VAGKKSIVMSEKNLTFCLSHQQKGVNKKNLQGSNLKKITGGNAKLAYL
jgi:hypothetical protein